MITLTVKKLQDRIYEFTEDGPEMNVDAYLVIGDQKAMMIDGLMAAEGLYEEARKLTQLPLEMIVLHGHPDHAGNGTKEFIEAGCPVYMKKEDLAILPEFDIHYPQEAFTWMTDGEVFDLGGMSLHVMSLPGHTPGSCILYCKEKNVIFSSDSMGSGDIWMWLPHSTTLSQYSEKLTPVLSFIREHPDVVIYVGHASQVPDYRGDGGGFTDLAYAEDLMEVTEDLIERKKEGIQIEDPSPRIKGVDVYRTSGKIMIGYTYDPKKL